MTMLPSPVAVMETAGLGGRRGGRGGASPPPSRPSARREQQHRHTRRAPASRPAKAGSRPMPFLIGRLLSFEVRAKLAHPTRLPALGFRLDSLHRQLPCPGRHPRRLLGLCVSRLERRRLTPDESRDCSRRPRRSSPPRRWAVLRGSASLPRPVAVDRGARGRPSLPHDARGEGRADEHALRLRGPAGREPRREGGGLPTLRGGDSRAGRRPRGRLLHPAEHDPARGAPPAGPLPERAPGDRPEDATRDPAAPDRGGNPRAHVLRGDGLPRGPRRSAARWDLGLFEAVYAATAREARAIGVHQVFTLVVEPNRDPRLGRNQEGYSEDPWLVSRIAETIVRAVQGERRVAARQGGGRPLPLPRPEPARERPRARGDGDLGADAARDVPAALGGGHPRGGRSRGHGDLPRDRRRARPRVGEDPDPDPARGAGLRGARPERGRRALDPPLRGPGADHEGGGRPRPPRRCRRGHLVRGRLHGRPRGGRAERCRAGGARRPRGAADPAPEAAARPVRASPRRSRAGRSGRPRPGAPGAGAARGAGEPRAAEERAAASCPCARTSARSP